MLGALAGPSELGRYAIMLKAVEALSMVLQTRSSYVLGRTVHLGEQDALDMTSQHAGVALRTALAAGLLGWPAYVVLVPALLGEGYQADRAWFGVLAVPALVLSRPRCTPRTSPPRPARCRVTASGVGLALAVPLYALLIPAYGVAGACAASAAVYLGQAAFVGRAFRRTRLQGGGATRALRTVPSTH